MALARASLLLSLTSLGFTQAAYAQPPTLQSVIGDPDDFKLSGSVRVRHELLDGQPRINLRPSDEQLALRTTLFGEYHKGDVRIGGEIYDSRVYLDRVGSAVSTSEVNTFELVQAYVAVDLKDVLGVRTSSRVQVGRMMINLGSRRLVAADDYRNTTNGYTGIRADFTGADKTTATLIYTLPQVRLPDDLPSIRHGKVRWDRESFDLRLWGGIVARPDTVGDATVEMSAFRLQEFDSPGRPTRNRNLTTVSARIIREPKVGRWDAEAEGIYQGGSIRANTGANAARQDVSAWFVHVDAGYSFAGKAKARLSFEYDYASGDGPGKRYGRFDTLFGMRRADLAPAGIYNALVRGNISTPAVRLEVAPTTRLDAFAAYRALWLADRTDAFSSTGVRDISGRSGSFAGYQAEARVRYWLIPSFLRAEIDALWLNKGRFLKTAPNAPRTGDTHYLATGVTATF